MSASPKYKKFNSKYPGFQPRKFFSSAARKHNTRFNPSKISRTRANRNLELILYGNLESEAKAEKFRKDMLDKPYDEQVIKEALSKKLKKRKIKHYDRVIKGKLLKNRYKSKPDRRRRKKKRISRSFDFGSIEKKSKKKHLRSFANFIDKSFHQATSIQRIIKNDDNIEHSNFESFSNSPKNNFNKKSKKEFFEKSPPLRKNRWKKFVHSKLQLIAQMNKRKKLPQLKVSPKYESRVKLEEINEQTVEFLENEKARHRLLGSEFHKFLADNLGVSAPKTLDPAGKKRVVIKNKRKVGFLRKIKQKNKKMPISTQNLDD